jgi:hypothetical protein
MEVKDSILVHGCFSISSKALVPSRVARRRHQHPNRALDHRMVAGSAQHPRRHVQAAMRSVSWSSTCRRCGARLVPTQGLGRTARVQGPGLGASEVVRDADWARDRLVRIGDGATAPSADLVAKQLELSGPSGSDRALGDDASLSSPLVPDRRGLDDEPAVGDAYLQGRMVEIAPRAMSDEGCNRLIDLPIQSDHVAARTQGNP